EDGIRDFHVTGVQTCALPISIAGGGHGARGSLETFVNGERDVVDGGGGEGVEHIDGAVIRGFGGAGDRDEQGRFGVVGVLLKPRSEERRVGKEWRDRG